MSPCDDCTRGWLRHQYAEDFGKSAPPTGTRAVDQTTGQPPIPSACHLRPNRASKTSAIFSEIFGECYASPRRPLRFKRHPGCGHHHMVYRGFCLVAVSEEPAVRRGLGMG